MSVVTQKILWDSPEACGRRYAELDRALRKVQNDVFCDGQQATATSSYEDGLVESYYEACDRRYRALEEITGRLISEGLLERESVEEGSKDPITHPPFVLLIGEVTRINVSAGASHHSAGSVAA